MLARSRLVIRASAFDTKSRFSDILFDSDTDTEEFSCTACLLSRRRYPGRENRQLLSMCILRGSHRERRGLV